MRRKVSIPLAAFLGTLLLASPGWAPPPGRPAPPPPRPTPPPVRPPITTPRPPGTAYRPLPPGARPPAYAAPNLAAALEAARRRSAAEAAELLRQQNAALSRAQRAALLNAITHDLLRQQQAASLDELRRLRADWVAVGPGAGLDPLVAMQLEAAESAAERLLLAEILKLVAGGKFAEALAGFAPLDAPRYLPAAVVLLLPELRAGLTRVAPFAAAQAGLRKGAPFPATQILWAVPADQVPQAVKQPLAAWTALRNVWDMLDSDRATGQDRLWTREELAATVRRVEQTSGAQLAGRLRVELAARWYLRGRGDEAARILDDGTDPVHATAVLADLQTIVLGRGAVTTPQVAAFVPASAGPPPQSIAILPPEQLVQWKPPVRLPGPTTLEAALAAEAGKLAVAVDAVITTVAGPVNTAADRVRAALAAEAAPQKVFLDKVEAARGKSFATPAEREFALAAGARGLTVAEAVGLLATDADRPAAAVRLLAAAPAFAQAGEFAASVELSGRAPQGFAPHPDAAFKLPPSASRAQIRAAVGAVIHAQAGKVVSGQAPPDFNRAALEASVRERLKLPPDVALTAPECAHGLLDVCRDWSDERAQLAEALSDLNQTVTDIEAGEYGTEDDELKELTQKVKLRRLTVQTDKKRRDAGLVIGCRLLGGYGADAAPARAWLTAQRSDDVPWREEATTALEKLGAK